MNKCYTYRIVIGDWSEDGHNRFEYFVFKCTHSEKEIKETYNKAVEKCGIALHRMYDENRRVTGISVCCDYENNTIPDYYAEKLKSLGINFNQFCYDENMESYLMEPKDITILFLEMVKSQIEGFEWASGEEAPCINGFWSNDFNHSFGYGCYE